MKEVTLSQALDLLKQYQNRRYEVSERLYRKKYNKVIRELTGEEFIMIDNKGEYLSLKEEYIYCTNVILSIQNAISEANSRITISNGLTISKAINKCKILKELVGFHKNIVSENKEDIKREFDGSGSSSYYVIKKFNGDIENALTEQRIHEVELVMLENEIKSISASTIIGIDI